MENSNQRNDEPDFARHVSEKMGYQGNGWSQYQIFVLKQLDDHGKFLERVAQRNSDTDLMIKMMQKEIEQNKEMMVKLEELLESFVKERSVDKEKVAKLEKEQEFEERLKSKSKLVWGTIGAVVMGIFSILMQLFDKIVKFFSN